MKRTTLLIAVAALLMGACCQSNENIEPVNGTDAVLNNIYQRKSVRQYTGAAIGADTIQSLLRAAMAAPTGMDIRPWSFVVLTDKSQYETIFAGNFNMKKFMESGAVIVVCADTTVTRPTREDPDGPAITRPNVLWRDDMGACTENLLLAVEAYGLGACWTACYPFPDTMKPVKEALGLPETVVPYAIVPIGVPAGDNQPKDKWDTTRIHMDRW
jgi:nitroreductase